jgi:hypothetical protein
MAMRALPPAEPTVQLVRLRLPQIGRSRLHRDSSTSPWPGLLFVPFGPSKPGVDRDDRTPSADRSSSRDDARHGRTAPIALRDRNN